METLRELICIGCPLGCSLQVTIEDGQVKNVTGNSCKRGEAYGIKECTNPTRIVTSSIKVEGGDCSVVSVKTSSDIPKGKIFECLKALEALQVKAPIKIGDTIVSNILNTGVDIIATKNVKAV